MARAPQRRPVPANPMNMNTLPRLAAIGCGFLACLALGSAAMAATVTVKAGSFFFNPTNPIINVGDTILWTNVSATRHDASHTPSSGPSLFGRPASDMAAAGTFAFTFTNAGFYPYACLQHIALFPQQTGTVTVVGPNIAPSVMVSNPVSNTSYGQQAIFKIQAAASDSDGTVTQVQFFANSTLLGRDASSPFEISVTNLPVGSHALTARATDNRGAEATSGPVTIMVTQPMGGVTNTVTVSDFVFSPQLLTIQEGDTVIWRNQGPSGHTATGESSGTEALCGTALLSGAKSCTNKFMTAGTYRYFCSVHPTTMKGTVVVVRATSPLVSITAPPNGAVFAEPALIFIEALASTEVGSVTQVSFFANGTNAGADSTSPFSATSSNLAAGIYTLTARAMASTGLLSTSAPVSISVVTPVPIVLSAPQITPQGIFRFDYTANPGLTYVLLRSTNSGPSLAQSPFATNVAAASLVTVTDTNVVLGSRAYSVIRPP